MVTNTKTKRIHPVKSFTKSKRKSKILFNRVKELLSRGVEEVIDRKNLEKQLVSGKKLRIKFGVDPTSPDLHLGHSVLFLKLKQFQELGHYIIFLIGDFTAQIGDPTGRTISRIPLSIGEIKENMKNYQQQASKILNMNKIEVRYNSEWWDKMNLREAMMLTTKVTYSQVSQRADFKKRLAEDKDFTLEEFMYPVLQGYDSVALKADLEIGGTDQKFNMLMGRRIQKRYKQKPQNVMTLKLLKGIDGKKKMSKTFKNFIAVSESSQNQFGKIMSMKDELILDYFKFCTKIPLAEIKQIEKELKAKKIHPVKSFTKSKRKSKILFNRVNPKEAKIKLAREIVSLYHNKKAAIEAEQEFDRIFKQKKTPSKIAIFTPFKKSYLILTLLFEAKLVSSKSEAKRIIQQGGVKIDKKTERNWQSIIKPKNGMIIQVGKRKFVKIRLLK